MFFLSIQRYTALLCVREKKYYYMFWLSLLKHVIHSANAKHLLFVLWMQRVYMYFRGNK